MELREPERPTSGRLIGREQELEQLMAAVGDARAGSGRLVLIGGEPGIGKSRLADELATRVRHEGGLALWGRGWEDAGAPPYWPWVQALRSLVRQSDPDAVRRQLGSGASEVAQMLPELHELFSDIEPRPVSQSDAARFQLFDSTVSFLASAAAARQLLVVLDDLQSADTPSLLFLQFLASQMTQVPIMVVGTYRDITLTPDHPLTAAIEELSREPGTRLMTLGGLDARSLAVLLGVATGTVPGQRAVDAVWRETKGNPLFVSETVRLLSAEGRIDEVADIPSLRSAIPAGIREVIARRIGHLGEPSGRVLALGAVLGPEFGIDVLRAVDDGDGDPELLDLLDEAVRSGLLATVPGTPGRYRFSHDLIREGLYQAMPASRRARDHLRIAQALERLHASAPEAHLAELAFHYFQAASADSASAAKAIDYATRAGKRASRALAYEEGARLFRMALALVDASAEASDEERIEILLLLGDVLARAGDPQAQAAFRQAAEIARRIGSSRQLARAALGIGGRVPWARPGHATDVIQFLQDALVALGGADDRLRVRLLTRLACAWRSTPDKRDQSAALSRQAIDIARALGDPATLSYATSGSYWTMWWPENAVERLQIAEDMMSLAEVAGDVERTIEAHLMLFTSFTDLGRMSEARTKLRDVIRLSKNVRGLTPSQLWLGLAPVAEMALIEGDYRKAADVLEEEAAYELQTTLARDDISAWRMHQFLLQRELGGLANIEDAVRASVEEFPWYPCHRAALALLLIDLDRRDEARAVLGELARDEFAALYRDNEWLLGMSMAAEASARLEERDAAAVAYRQLLPFAGLHAVGHAEGSVGVVDRYLGLLAMALGELDEAERHLVDAIRIHQEMGATPWTAHTQHDLADLLRLRAGRGDAARAAELDATALATARSLGAIALDKAITGGAPARSEQDVAAGTFLREGEFWTISFDGTTTRLRDAKGLHHLATLLAQPGRELHALDLAKGPSATSAGRRSGDEGMSADAFGDAGPRLDEAARAEYRERLSDLADEARQADEWNDSERAQRARSEMEFLAAELSGAFGLGGRQRKSSSAAERARLSVTRAIRSAMSRIAEGNPSLGGHLEATIRTGTFCSYQPDPRLPISWEL